MPEPRDPRRPAARGLHAATDAATTDRLDRWQALMFVVTWKAGARWDVPTSAGVHILGALDRAAPVCRTTLEITSGTDGTHSGPDDPHKRGVAFDVSVHGFSPGLVVQVKTYLEQILGSLFTVLYECPSTPTEPQLAPIALVNPQASAPHFHIQPKRGTVWPPLDPALRA